MNIQKSNTSMRKNYGKVLLTKRHVKAIFPFSWKKLVEFGLFCLTKPKLFESKISQRKSIKRTCGFAIHVLCETVGSHNVNDLILSPHCFGYIIFMELIT